MKFSNGSMILSLFTLLIVSASAEETILPADQNITVLVVTTMKNPVLLSAPTLQAIDDAIKLLEPEIDVAVESVSGNATIPSTRQLRVNDDRKLGVCRYCETAGQVCYVWPTSYPKCPGRRALKMHERLSEDAILELTEDDRRRNMEITTACEKATGGVNDIIYEAAMEGIVPLLPLGSEFVETCFYVTD